MRRIVGAKAGASQGLLPAQQAPEAAGGMARGGRRGIAVLVLAAAAFLGILVVAGLAAHADLTRGPTAAQRSAAAAAAVAARWRTWSAGRIFPAALSYDTDLLTTEDADRIGISTDVSCASAIEPSLARLAGRDHCQAGLRAAYLDQLQGIVYTIGVLAFSDAHMAAAFSARLPAAAGTIPLRALALPGTASARFSADARQATASRHDGSFVVLTVAGYADGEPVGAGQEARPAIFAPAMQLATEIMGLLIRPLTVNCHSPEWLC